MKDDVEIYREQIVLTGGKEIQLVVNRQCNDWENSGWVSCDKIDQSLCLVLLEYFFYCCSKSYIHTLKNSLTMTLTKLYESELLTQNTTTFPLLSLRNCSNFVKTLTASVSEKGTPLHLNLVSICFDFSFVNMTALVRLNI